MNKIKTIMIMIIPILLIAQINWTEHILINNIKPVNSIFTIDINGDSAMDVLAATASFVDSADLYWFKNDGSFSPQFTMDTIDNTADCYYYDVYAIDLDGDNDIDVLSAAYGYEDNIIWYENNGDSLPTFTRHILDAGFDGAVSIKAGDLDHDGDNDILGASYDSGVLAWWENIGGSPPSFTKRIIDDTYSGAFAILPVYINGDSAMDILSISMDLGCVTWWRNDGGIPPSFMKQTIDSDYYPSSLYGCDIDGDGGNDVLATGDNLSYWLNDGSDTPFKDQHIIDEGNNLRSVYACDLDHDGDNDVLVMVGTGSSGEVIWYENNGPPNFFKHSIGWLTGVSVVYANDLDGDGDIDVLAGSVYEPFKIRWWESDLLDIHDATVASIDIPSTIHPDTTLYPQTTVANLGSKTISFPVTCKIEPGGYTSTRTIFNLTPGDSLQVEFFTEFTFESGTYMVTVYTRLGDDDSPLNDTLMKEINVVLADVAPVSIDIPSTLPENTTLNPHATIKNNGTNTETFSVICTIDPGEYTSTTVSNIAAGESIQVTFPDAFTFENGSYTVTVYTNLDIDEIPTNDTLEKVIDATGIAEDGSDTPISFSFGLKNNPVKDMAMFNLALPEAAAVTLRIYDVSGRLIENLVSGRKPAGHYEIYWDPKIASGVYFYKFQSPWKHEVGKLVLVR